MTKSCWDESDFIFQNTKSTLSWSDTRYAAETCAHTCQKPWPLGGTQELQGKNIFWIQGERALGGSCLWGPGW